jgi:hypothetical protein
MITILYVVSIQASSQLGSRSIVAAEHFSTVKVRSGFTTMLDGRGALFPLGKI